MNINKEAVENNSLFKFLKKYWIPILAVIVTIAVIISTIGIYKEEIGRASCRERVCQYV